MQTDNRTALPGLKEKRYRQKKDIISDLYRMDSLSKPEICRMTKMTTPTISKIIEELMEEGWVTDLGQGPSIGGKRPHIFSLNPDAAYILGIDLGREKLKIAIFNLHKKVMGKIQEYPSLLETGQTNETIVSDLKSKIEQSLQEIGISQQKIKVAGVSLPGLLDNEGNSYTYLRYSDTNIRKVLEGILGIPVFIDNDSSVMAMAEHSFGAARGASHALCVNINECIGLGMILNSRPYGGFKGMAGEFGHLRVSGTETLCYCGKAGCLETVASGRAIVKAALQVIAEGKATSIHAGDGSVLCFADVIEAAGKGDICAIELLQKAGEKTGEALAGLIHLFNPELIVIGGEITKAKDIILSSIRQAIDRYAITRLKNQCEIKTSSMDSRSCILGTLCLVMEHIHNGSENDFSLY